MQEKYYIDIDEKRVIQGRYIDSIHKKIPSTAQEVKKEVFDTSIQENHNYLNDDLTTCIKDVRTAEEIAEEERLAKLPTAEEIEKAKIEVIVLNLMAEGGLI